MTYAEELAQFVVKASYEHLSERTRHQLKLRLIDSIGCAIGAIEGEPVRMVRQHIEDFSEGGTQSGHCTLIGGGKASPERAALYNSALVRYLDFNDSFLAKGETCHPSDNIGAILAGAEYAHASTRDFLVALAVAYEVHCRLSEAAPVRSRGFDHTTQGSFALAAGISKILRLSHRQTTNAIALCGTAFNALRVTRTGSLSHWKGLAYPNAAFACTHAVFLALRGITGPSEVFEGNKGFMQTISGPFKVDWSNLALDRLNRTILKKYNAEIHAQSAIEGALDLKQEHRFTADQISEILIDTFDVAYNIIGAGEEGNKMIVRNKEEADHSLHYLLAVAILDGKVMPEQYRIERVQKEDVQNLLRKIQVRPDPKLSERFPEQMPCRLTVLLKNGQKLTTEKTDYEGFHTRPMDQQTVVKKFRDLTKNYLDLSLSREILEKVMDFENVQLHDFMRLLARIRMPAIATVH